jgi:hypothetical protein
MVKKIIAILLTVLMMYPATAFVTSNSLNDRIEKSPCNAPHGLGCMHRIGKLVVAQQANKITEFHSKEFHRRAHIANLKKHQLPPIDPTAKVVAKFSENIDLFTIGTGGIATGFSDFEKAARGEVERTLVGSIEDVAKAGAQSLRRGKTRRILPGIAALEWARNQWYPKQ